MDEKSTEFQLTDMQIYWLDSQAPLLDKGTDVPSPSKPVKKIRRNVPLLYNIVDCRNNVVSFEKNASHIYGDSVSIHNG